jgi:hypothetical protein
MKTPPKRSNRDFYIELLMVFTMIAGGTVWGGMQGFKMGYKSGYNAAELHCQQARKAE